MRTIFDKDSDGVGEMREYFPHISGLVQYSKLESNVLVAQSDIAKYIGDAIIIKAVEHYHSNEFRLEEIIELDPVHYEEQTVDINAGLTALNLTLQEALDLRALDELVFHLQFAVTLFAYRDYAMNNDATHTNSGRKARMDKDADELNLKLIAQDDDALFKKSYKAMDRLISFIDTIGFAEWVASEPYRKTRDVFLWNAELFHTYFPIDKSRYLFLLTLPMQREAQTSTIYAILGKERYESLLAKVKANTLFVDESGSGSGSGSGTGSNEDDRRLFDLVASVLVKITMATAYQQLPIQLFPESIARQLWSAGNGAAAITVRKTLIEDIMKLADRSALALSGEITRLESLATETEITDASFISIADRLSETNLFGRV